jgi:hypothetical protein
VSAVVVAIAVQAFLAAHLGLAVGVRIGKISRKPPESVYVRADGEGQAGDDEGTFWAVARDARRSPWAKRR